MPGLCEAAASEFIGHTWWEVITDQWNKQHRVAHLISFLLIDDRLISVLRKVILVSRGIKFTVKIQFEIKAFS